MIHELKYQFHIRTESKYVNFATSGGGFAIRVGDNGAVHLGPILTRRDHRWRHGDGVEVGSMATLAG
jgi:hypothetical protein